MIPSLFVSSKIYIYIHLYGVLFVLFRLFFFMLHIMSALFMKYIYIFFSSSNNEMMKLR